MFSRKSPNETRTSPRWITSSIRPLRRAACAASATRTTSPPASITVGGSIESTSATVAPFPGMSILTCVPTVIVWPRISATAGWNPTAANPVLHALPYRSRKPPSRPGVDSTDRPMITSRMRLAAAPSLSPVWSAPRRPASHSHPSRSYMSMRLSSFLDLPMRPSLRTRSAPPRTRSVLIRRMPLWFTTSTGSVSTPSSSTGRFDMTVTISSSWTRYWNPMPDSRSYTRSSSTNRPVSSSNELATYRDRPAVLRTWSASSIVTADSVPPADRIGPAIDTDRYSLSSLFFFMDTSEMPCSGAIVTPSVTMARPTLTAMSRRSTSFASGGRYLPRAISSERRSAVTSLPCDARRSRRSAAMSISCILATRSAMSYAMRGSTLDEASTSVDFAAAAASNSAPARLVSPA